MYHTAHTNLPFLPSLAPQIEVLCVLVRRYYTKCDLFCRWYTNGNHPFLRIGPVAMEEMFHDPWIIVFHNVLSDREIEVIKELAMPKVGIDLRVFPHC